MSNQQVVAPRGSANGFGPRRGENKPHSAKSTGIMNGGRLNNASPSRDRIMYVMVYLIGQRVDVHVKNGSVITGILHTANEKDFGIVLKMAQITKDGSARGQKSLADIVKKPETMIIPSRELVQIVAKDVALTSDELANNAHATDKRKDLMIDSVISNSRNIEERELERWAPDGDELDCLELEQPLFGRKWGTRKWDQFETNEALFGVKSTFNEDIYTTKLVKGPHMKELEMHASRIAREIESQETDDLHLAEERSMEFLDNLEMDEELRYSAVTRDTTDSWRSGRESYTDSRRRPSESQTDSWRRPNDSWRPQETLQNPPSMNVINSIVNINNNNNVHERENNGIMTKDDHVDLPTSSSSLDGDAISQPVAGTKSNECDDSAEKKSKSVDDNNNARLEENQIKDGGEEFLLSVQADIKSCSEEAKVSGSEGVPIDPKKAEETKVGQSKPSSESTKAGPTPDAVNSGQRPCSSTSNTSALSRTSSIASDKSSLNPNAKEFKLNPHARSFMPVTSSNLRPMSPAPPPPPIMQQDSSFYYQPNLPPQNMHQIHAPLNPMGGGFGGQQPFMYNPQTGAPLQQAYLQPNAPPYGQPQMMMGQPQARPVYYMPGYPPEMQYRGRNY